MYKVTLKKQFRKDFALMKRRGMPLDELQTAITVLASGSTLAPEYKDHPRPFCGVKPVIKKCYFDDKGFVINHDMRVSGAAVCPIAEWGEESMIGSTVYESRREAIKDWNNRIGEK